MAIDPRVLCSVPGSSDYSAPGSVTPVDDGAARDFCGRYAAFMSVLWFITVLLLVCHVL